MKKRLLILSVVGISLLFSCGNNEADSNGSSTIDASQTEICSKPAAEEKTQIYQKRAFPVLRRGMTIKLDEFFGVVPGKNEDQNATALQAYMVKSSSENYVGYLTGGDGKSLDLLFVRPGEVTINLYANGVYKTITLNVEENEECGNLVKVLSKVKSNYTATQFKYNDDGEKVVVQKVYRSSNYIYGATTKSGYLLSKKDDNIYSFSLPSVESDELDIDMSPQGDKADYNGTFLSLDATADNSYWQYSALFQNSASLKKFKYAFAASSSLTKRLFKSLFLMNDSYEDSSPYLMFASYQNNELSFLPVLANSDGTKLSYMYEFTISSVDSTRVAALDDYVDQYKAPTPTDVSQIRNAIKYMSGLVNWTLDAKLSYIGEDGKKLSSRSPYMNIFKGGNKVAGLSGSLPDLTRYAGIKKITEKAYFGTRYGGSEVTGFRQGGLWSTNNTTYNYYETETDSGVYKVTRETIEASNSSGQSRKYPNWWSYAFMQRHLIGLSLSTTSINNAFPLYDEGSNTFTFTGKTDSSYNVIISVIAMCYHADITQYSNPFRDFFVKNYGTLDWSFTYSNDKVLTGMNLVVKVRLPKEYFPSFDQDYYWVMDCAYSDIGTTSLDSIISTLSVPTDL